MNFSWISPRSRPIVIAHRGSSGKAPENTTAAFRLACKERADAIELDVHLSKDGHAVVIHDGYLGRTTDGSGPVRNYTLQQLKKFNAASRWKQKYSFEAIPTLDEVLKEFGFVIGINIEIKGERRDVMQQKLLSRCIALVRKYKLHSTVMISSFSSKTIEETGKLDPRIIRGLLYDPLFRPLRSPAAYAKSLGVQYLIMSRKRLLKRTISAIHLQGMMMGEYAVNSKSHAIRSLKYGIDAIYTDYPSEIRTYLNSMK